MNELIPSLFLLFFSSFPYWLLSYYPFRDKMRLSSPLTLTITAGIELLLLAVTAWGLTAGISWTFLYNLFIPVCLLTDLALIRVRPGIIILFFLLIMDYLLMIQGVAYYLLSVCFHAAATGVWHETAIMLLLFLVTSPFVLMFLHRSANIFFEIDMPRLWHSLWIVPAFTSVLVLRFTRPQGLREVGMPLFLFIRMGLLLTIFIIYYTLLNTLKTQKKQLLLQQRVEAGQQLLTLQKKQYSGLLSAIEEMRRTRHDIRHHMMLIQAYLNDGRPEELKNYVEQYVQSLTSDKNRSFCNNYTVNALVSFYAEMAQKEHILFDCHIEAIPESLFILESDLCVLFGNLLENAINAGRLHPQDAYIRVRAHTDGSRSLILTVDNSPAPCPRFTSDGSLLSGTHAGVGIGTLSVRSIAEKYCGKADFHWRDNTFYASVYLEDTAAQTAT